MVVAVGAVAIASASASAEVVAGWDFNASDTPGTIAAAVGKGSLDLAEVGGEVDFFAGTTANALEGWRSGEALGLRGADAGGVLIAHAFLGDALATESVDATLSFATRRSDTGFSNLRVDWWSGTAWTLVDTVSVGSDWSVSTVSWSLPDGIDDLTWRLTPLDATAGAGTFRLDNMVLETRVVPAPGTAVLASVAGVVAGRRRRRDRGG